MIVGILGDTHDNLPMIARALARFAGKGAQALVHAGDFIAPFALKAVLKFDGPVYAVFGNNDGERAGLKTILPDLGDGPRRVSLADRTIVLVHKESDLAEADRTAADVVVVGHTHEAEVREGTPLTINPGECGGWLKGRCTVATLDTDTLDVQIHDIGA
jgi:putative phosphoesterase